MPGEELRQALADKRDEYVEEIKAIETVAKQTDATAAPCEASEPRPEPDTARRL